MQPVNLADLLTLKDYKYREAQWAIDELKAAKDWDGLVNLSKYLATALEEAKSDLINELKEIVK